MEKFKVICDLASESIVITDDKANIIYVNDACCDLTGYSRTELIGQNPRILKSGLQDESIYKDMWNVLLNGEIWRGELANRRKDGSIYWEKTVIASFDNNGSRYYLGIKEDITTLKRLEKKIQSLVQLSHEFINPV